VIDCFACGTEFEVEFSDDFDGAEVKFCPCCGEDLDVEIEFDE
jgi:rRNA maturation endonuclease Nob1